MKKIIPYCALLLLNFILPIAHAESVCIKYIVDFVFHDALVIEQCGVDDRDMYKVDRFLHQHPEITGVYLRGNNLSSEGALLLSVLPLKYVDLSDNMIGDDGVIELAKNPYLESFTLNGNKGISIRAAKYLSATPSLKSLYLANNNIDEATVAILLKNHNLKTLNLAKNKLTNSAVTVLVNNSHIKELDLADNNLTDEAAAILANSALTYLNLANNQISDNGAISLAMHPSLRALNLKNNRVSDAGAAALATNPHLEYLLINDNHIGDEGAIALAASDISALWIKGNPIGPKGIEALRNSGIQVDI